MGGTLVNFEVTGPDSGRGDAREAEIKRIMEKISFYAAPMIAGALVAVLREDEAPPEVVAEAEAVMARVLKWWADRDKDVAVLAL